MAQQIGRAITFMLAGIGFLHLMQLFGLVGSVISASDAQMFADQAYESELGMTSYPYDRRGNIKSNKNK